MSLRPSRVSGFLLGILLALHSVVAFGATTTALVPAAAPHGAHVIISGTGLDASGIGVFFSDPTGAAVPAAIVSRSADAIEAIVPVQAASGIVRLSGSMGTIGTFDFTVSPDPAFVKISTLAADLKQPSGTSVSTAGVAYIADRMHHQIRLIAPDGSTRIAGTGKPGLVDGPASTAQFNEPRGVVFDAARSILYVADTGNNVIRRISVDGVVSTFAGSGHPAQTDGTGTQADFKNPVGLALDSIGNVLVADTGNHSIRSITPAGVVTTLAGGVHDGFADGAAAQALFKLPEGVAVAMDGAAYVADTGNNLVRRIANGNVTTIAGTGHPGLVDGGVSLAEFKEPAAIAIDDNGALLIADRGNDAIRRVANGVVSTIAPNVGWKTPSGISSEGIVLVGDSGNDTARVIYRALSVSAVYPARGLTTGGNVIRVFGTGFVPGATRVSIGGTLADVSYVTSTELLVTVPAGAVGSVDVKVETAAGSATLSGAYTYVSPLPPPTITSVAPQKGATAGGQALTIIGTNFTPQTTATIGGLPASVNVISPTMLTLITPAHSEGAVDVTITTSAGSATRAAAFTYFPPPVITVFFPRFTVPNAAITIDGTGFDTDPLGNTVMFAGIPAPVTSATSTEIHTLVPIGARNGQITVTTAGGSATSSQFFFIITISQITIPSQPPLDAGAIVQLSAKGTFTDGSTRDVTTQVTWASDTPSVATVSATGLVTAIDAGQATISATTLGVTGTTTITVKPPAPLPPDPSTIATPTNPTIVAPLSDSLRFLYEGPNAIQTGVPLGTITDERATLIRGRVLTIDGTPLGGVTVTILGHPEFGQTISRANGGYDLVVNGGGSLVLKFEKARYVPAQRRAIVNWNEQKVLDDVALVAYDANVTTIALDAQDAQVARGSIMSDADGTRRATLIFPAHIGVGIVLPDGTTKFVTSLNVRATEFTVGPNGTNAMPAALPASSAYTYCVELSADEAVAVGATTVNFSKPVSFYVENFLNFPVGGVVPSGYYDRTRASWLASTNGRVVKVLSITNGLADLDIRGFGSAASSSDLAQLGVDDAERQKLATLYAPGQSLWRVPITHFTPYDHNWPIGLPLDAKAPDSSTGPTYFTPCECGDEATGSIVNVHNQSLSESIPIAGTPFSLVYNSSRVSKATRYKMDMALTGATIPSSLHRIDFTVQVAGRSFRASYAPGTNLKGSFTWDGLDAYGRPVQGAQNATVTLDYVYSSTYAAPVTSDQAFAEFGFGSLNLARASSEKALTRVWTLPMGQMSMQNTGFGGWVLDAQHFYDGNGRVLYDGIENRYADPENIQTLAVSTVAGGVCCTAPVSGSLATSGFLDGTASIGFLPDGSFYVGNAFNRKPTIFRVDTSGIITTYAGGDFFGFTPDGPIGPGSALGFTDIATGPDGTLYMNEPPRVRKIANGFVTTIEGGVSSNVGPCSVDGLPAASVDVGATHIAVGSDGTVYLASGRVYAITSDGIIHRVAGSCDFSATYIDGGPALNAPLSAQAVTVARDGTLYIADSHGTYRVNADGRIYKIGGGIRTDSNTAQFAVTADGTVLLPTGRLINAIASNDAVTTLVGGGTTVFRTPPPNGTLARAAGLSSVYGVQIAPDGSVYVVDPGFGAIFRTQPIFPAMRRAGTVVPSPDASEAYLFQNGRHTQTIDPLTNATVFSFSYDASGNLTAITDTDNNTVTIQRNGTGEPTAIVAPGGQRTTLALTNGNLTSIADPAGLTNAFTYNAAGLLETLTDPRHNTHRFTYDVNGLLTRDEDPAGGFISLIRTPINGGFSIARSSAEGHTQRYDLQIGSDLTEHRTNVGTDGLIASTSATANHSSVTLPDGTTISTSTLPDPRFGASSPFNGGTTTRLPSGLTLNVTRTATATMSDPSNPLLFSTLTNVTAVNGKSWTTVYTAGNHTATTTSPSGRTITSVFDSKGRLISASLPNLAPITFTYDNTGLLTATTEGPRTTTFVYDAARRLASITDPLQETVRLTYDSSDRVISQIWQDGRTVAFHYDDNGNLTGVTPPARSQHTFAFTATDLVASYAPPALPNTASTTFAYSKDHQLTLITRADGSTMIPRYDSAGRLSVFTTSDGDSVYRYDATSGALNSITTPEGGSVAFTYDGSLQTSESWAGAVSGRVTHTYDSNFRIATENGVSYQYDADGLLTAAGGLSIQRDAQNGLMTGASLGNVSDSWTYNPLGEPLTHTVLLAGAAAFQEQYTRDGAGRITQLVETNGGRSASVSYTYDSAGRLATVTRDGQQTTSYSYDANGNRVPGTYDDQDRMIAMAGSTYAYTANGELATKTTATGATTYGYDPYGNLRSIVLQDGHRIDYTIDALGRRVGKKIDGTLVAGWLYAGHQRIVAETDASGSIAKQFVYGTRGNVPDYMVFNGLTYRIVTDHLGSPRFVIETTAGSVVETITYDEFGNVLSDSNPGFQPFGFAGGLYDRDSGLVHFGARDYDPQAARWIAKDPTGFGGRDANLYAYVHSDPVNFVDPNGLGSERDVTTMTCPQLVQRIMKHNFDISKLINDEIQKQNAGKGREGYAGHRQLFENNKRGLQRAYDEWRRRCYDDNDPGDRRLAEKAEKWLGTSYPDPLPPEVTEEQREQMTNGLLVVGGAATIVGTIIEDFGTGGVGVLDDPATISAGATMIAKGMGWIP